MDYTLFMPRGLDGIINPKPFSLSSTALVLRKREEHRRNAQENTKCRMVKVGYKILNLERYTAEQ